MSKAVKPGYVRPLDLRHGRVEMIHGSGGRAMAQLASVRTEMDSRTAAGKYGRAMEGAFIAFGVHFNSSAQVHGI